MSAAEHERQAVAPPLGEEVWDRLLDRGPVILVREVATVRAKTVLQGETVRVEFERLEVQPGRLLIRFDCLRCADLEASAFICLDDGSSGCVRCGATFDRETILDLTSFGPRQGRDGV